MIVLKSSIKLKNKGKRINESEIRGSQQQNNILGIKSLNLGLDAANVIKIMFG